MQEGVQLVHLVQPAPHRKDTGTGAIVAAGDITRENARIGNAVLSTAVWSKNVGLTHTRSTSVQKLSKEPGIVVHQPHGHLNLKPNKIKPIQKIYIYIYILIISFAEESRDGNNFVRNDKEVLYYTNFDLQNLVTPVNADVLERLLLQSNYDRKKSAKIVKGFRTGFSLGYRGPKCVKLTAPNLKLNVGDETDLWNKVMKEVKLRRYAGPFPFETPPFKYFIQSPIGLVPKDGGTDTRLIFHLSYPKTVAGNGKSTSVNTNIPEKFCKVKYPDFEEAIKLCQEAGFSCFLSRSDMKMAFRNLCMKKRYWKFLMMKARSPIEGKWHLVVDKCVSFGSAASCKIFQDFSDCIAHIVEWRVGAGRKVTNYLDDFLFIALLKWLISL